MNKALASYLFDGEMLFSLKENGVSGEVILAKPETVVQLIDKETVVLSTSLTNKTKELLSKILESVNVSLNEVDLILVDEFKNFTWGKCGKIICFGDSKAFGLNGEKYKVGSFNEKKMLLADALDIIEKNENGEKRLLWTGLKALFPV